jgi:O-antigen ligase
LCRWYRRDPERLRPEVLSGLLGAAAIAAGVAVYQGFVDLGFLNKGFWEYMIRASGTMADPNKLGSVAAFWTIGAIVFSRRLPRPWSAVIAVAGVMLGVAAVWVSGSRTGLAVVLVAVPLAAYETLRWSRLDARTLAKAAGGAIVIGALLVVALQNASTHTIVQRGTLGYLPFVGDRGIRASANELLWDRFGYGPVAIQMVKEHPVSGVGVGMYHTLSHDFGQAIGRTIPMPDNAQAWWRHNLAELGVLGIIPLLVWCVVFGRQLFAKSASGDRLAIGILRGVLIATFIASLFGVPSQSVAIALTFWVFVFWFLVEHGGLADQTVPPRTWPRALTIAAVAIIVSHAGSTLLDANGDLRPRNRSMRFNWFYKYGMSEVELDPGANPVGRRLTMQDSLAVIQVKGKVLKFVAWVDHPDAEQRPVHTRVWADGMLIYEGDMRRDPLFIDIPATPGKTHMILETSVDRVWRPSDFGSRDRREIGLSIRDWVWE